MFLLSALSLLACDKPTPTAVVDEVPTPADVTVRLGPDETRAGPITDDAALFGGITAEGRIGDFKIYNDRAQFVIQGIREGSYYIQVGGGVIDADAVRPEGEPGRDTIEETNVMIGFGRLLEPETIEVVDDGSTSGLAHIRVTGTDTPLSLLRGALENPGFGGGGGFEVVHDYKLAAGTPLLEVTTTVTASEAASLQLGDVMLGAPEIADAYISGGGLEREDAPVKPFAGYVGKRNDGAVGLFAAAGETLGSNPGADLLASLVDLVTGFDEVVQLEAGQTHTWTRYYGAGLSMSELSDARIPGAPVETGTVTAGGEPVAGARVHLLVDGDPYTVAFTGPDGTFSASAPPGASVTLLSEGRGRGIFTDLPEGAASWPAFGTIGVREEAALTLSSGAIGRPYAQGYGAAAGLELAVPGTIEVSVDDAEAFALRVGPSTDDTDPALVPSRPNGLQAAGWSTGNTLRLTVAPGTYDVLAHRGARHEVNQTSLTVVAGETVTWTASMPEAFAHPGYLWADPHSHGAPSGDGQVSMEERLLVHAAGGVQLHFGSDHDRVADYRPLLIAMGLDDQMESIVSDEVSSVIRGHMNAYPLEPNEDLANNGAVQWWREIPATTQALVDQIRERHQDVLVQANHPTDNGVMSASGWSPGQIGRADYWVSDLDAIEVLNDGQHEEYTEVWMDLVHRGYDLVPVGVSDAHGHFNGPAGLNGTWLGGSSEVASAGPADVRGAFATGDVVASLGVFLDLSVPPGSTLNAPTILDVEALSASWATVNRLVLYENGLPVETVEGPIASFAIGGTEDAGYVVMAEGDGSMSPVSGRRPWALSNLIRFDPDDDGWTPPNPPLQ